jgi:hypothetical protein
MFRVRGFRKDNEQMSGLQAFDLSFGMDVPQTFFLERYVEYFLKLFFGQPFYLFNVIDEYSSEYVGIKFIFFRCLFCEFLFWKTHDFEDVFFDLSVFFLE